jgi:hypothetical protein
MCTVSVLRGPFDDWRDDLNAPRWRVVFNRDERRTRAAALLPEVQVYGDVRVARPIDPDGGGTWIAGTSQGLVFALLNESDAPLPHPAGRPHESRGLVIPSLADSGSLDEVVARMSRRPVGLSRPYRLLAIADEGIIEFIERRGRHVMRSEPMARFIRTSSTVAPDETCRRRTALFDSLVLTSSAASQDGFHRHRWPDDLSSSVLMERPDARTVSLTTIEAFASGFRVTYRPWPSGATGVTEVPRAA